MKYCKQLLITVFCSCIIYVAAYAQTKNTILKNFSPVHPRLFANDKKIEAIKLQKDAVTKQLVFILKSDAEKKLLEPDIAFSEGIGDHLYSTRLVQGRILTLALAYRMFGDKRYLKKARTDLLQLSAKTNWGTNHFLDVGEASLAAGTGLDWLYHALSVKDRDSITKAIINNALLPSLQIKEGENNTSWVNGNFNWNPVCHAGLLTGALAIAEKEPELAGQIIERAIKNIPYAGAEYGPDGAYAEGPSYWSYGTSFYVIAVEVLRTALGNSAGLEKIPGFMKTADYNNQMVAPSGLDYNYADYHGENLNEPVMIWFASQLNRPDLIEDELFDIRVLHDSWKKGAAAKPVKKLVQSRHLSFELLWWKPSLLATSVAGNATGPIHWTATGLMPIAVMRSSWADSMATFVAIKGGTPNNSHGHMDAGSFIMEAMGVRWALDMGVESYDKMRAAKLKTMWSYEQASDRWSTYRIGPEGHNIPRFDNDYQLVTGRGEVKALDLKNGVMGNEADLTSLYKNKASKMIRSVWLHPDKSVAIQDEWKTKDSAVNYSFQWLTKAAVTKTADGFLLKQNGKSLDVKIEEPKENFVVEVQDVSKARAAQDSDNPEVSRIVISSKTPAKTNGKLTIRAYPGKEGF